jgi:hypothetical protein
MIAWRHVAARLRPGFMDRASTCGVEVAASTNSNPLAIPFPEVLKPDD